MTYRVKHDDSPRDSFGEYRYQIFRGNQLVAYFWHDYRGDDNGIDFVGGGKEGSPLGTRAAFLAGGGPEPLMLTQNAIRYLERKLP